MIVEIKPPKIGFPRLSRQPSRKWRRWFILIPRLVYTDGEMGRKLILPGWHETRISCSQNRRIWREIGKQVQS